MQCPYCGFQSMIPFGTCPHCSSAMPSPPPGAPPPAAPQGWGAPPQAAPGAWGQPPAGPGYPPQPPVAYPPTMPGFPAPTAVAPWAAAAGTLPNSGLGIASMVVGICSIVLYPLGIVAGPTAIGLFFPAWKAIKSIPPTRRGGGMAIAGLVCGIVGTIVGIVFILAVTAWAHSELPHYRRQW
jgi:hypothetical protein